MYFITFRQWLKRCSVLTDRRTDMMKVIIAYRNFGKTPRNEFTYSFTYGIELWGCACKSNIAIMQRYQSKFLRFIANASWYVTNQTLHTDLQIPYVRTVIHDRTNKHRIAIASLPNPLVEPMLHPELNRRLKRRWIFDLTD